MKRAVPILITLAALLAGCATWERANREWERWTRPDPPAEQPADPTQPKPPEADNNRFLWKPISESRPGAAVLFPARLTVDSMTANGDDPAENRGRTNGNRPTFFMPHRGAHYGSPVLVIAYHGGAEVGRWTVPNGANRFER